MPTGSRKEREVCPTGSRKWEVGGHLEIWGSGGGEVQLGPDLAAGLRLGILTPELDDHPWCAGGVGLTAGTGVDG